MGFLAPIAAAISTLFAPVEGILSTLVPAAGAAGLGASGAAAGAGAASLLGATVPELVVPAVAGGAAALPELAAAGLGAGALGSALAGSGGAAGGGITSGGVAASNVAESGLNALTGGASPGAFGIPNPITQLGLQDALKGLTVGGGSAVGGGTSGSSGAGPSVPELTVPTPTSSGVLPTALAGLGPSVGELVVPSPQTSNPLEKASPIASDVGSLSTLGPQTNLTSPSGNNLTKRLLEQLGITGLEALLAPHPHAGAAAPANNVGTRVVGGARGGAGPSGLSITGNSGPDVAPWVTSGAQASKFWGMNSLENPNG